MHVCRRDTIITASSFVNIYSRINLAVLGQVHFGGGDRSSVCSVGWSIDLDDDRAVYETVTYGHGDGRITHVLCRGVEVDIDDED